MSVRSWGAALLATAAGAEAAAAVTCRCLGGGGFGNECARWDAPDEQPWCRVAGAKACGEDDTFESEGHFWAHSVCGGEGKAYDPKVRPDAAKAAAKATPSAPLIASVTGGRLNWNKGAPNFKSLFDSLDADGDGTISVAEQGAFMRPPPPGATVCVVQSDTIGTFKFNGNAGGDDGEIVRDNILLASTYINAHYAHARGYAYHFERLPPMVKGKAGDRHPSWKKVPLVKRLLLKYQYVLFVDSDAYVRQFDGWFEDVIVRREFVENGNIMVLSRDLSMKVCFGCFDRFNGGIWAVKNSSITHEMFEDWWEAPARYPGADLQLGKDLPVWEWAMEQRSLHAVIYDKYKKHGIKAFDFSHEPAMNGWNGRYVRHLSGWESWYKSTISMGLALCTWAYAQRSPDDVYEGARTYLASKNTRFVQFFDEKVKRYYAYDTTLKKNCGWIQDTRSPDHVPSSCGASTGVDVCSLQSFGVPIPAGIPIPTGNVYKESRDTLTCSHVRGKPNQCTTAERDREQARYGSSDGHSREPMMMKENDARVYIEWIEERLDCPGSYCGRDAAGGCVKDVVCAGPTSLAGTPLPELQKKVVQLMKPSELARTFKDFVGGAPPAGGAAAMRAKILAQVPQA